MKKASDIVAKLLAALLLIAAALKGWQLLTEPVANSDIWSYRPFLILTVEFELALGLWLLSGLFKKSRMVHNPPVLRRLLSHNTLQSSRRSRIVWLLRKSPRKSLDNPSHHRPARHPGPDSISSAIIA